MVGSARTRSATSSTRVSQRFSLIWIRRGGEATPSKSSVVTGSTAQVFYGARYVSHGTTGQNVQLSYRVEGRHHDCCVEHLGHRERIRPDREPDFSVPG